MGTVAVMALLAGAADLLGGWLTLALAFSRKRMDQLMALGTGFLLGGAFFAMLPGAMALSHHSAEFVAVGFLGLFALRLVTTGAYRATTGPAAESAWAAVAGLTFHSFLDGAALGVAAHVDSRLGLMAFLAVFLHKLPEGFSLATVVLSATGSERLALLATGAVGLASVAGAGAAVLWAESAALSAPVLMGLAAGSFLYIGAVEMLPAVARKGGSAWLVLSGAALVYLLAGLGGHTHAH